MLRINPSPLSVAPAAASVRTRRVLHPLNSAVNGVLHLNWPSEETIHSISKIYRQTTFETASPTQALTVSPDFGLNFECALLPGGSGELTSPISLSRAKSLPLAANTSSSSSSSDCFSSPFDYYCKKKWRPHRDDHQENRSHFPDPRNETPHEDSCTSPSHILQPSRSPLGRLKSCRCPEESAESTTLDDAASVVSFVKLPSGKEVDRRLGAQTNNSARAFHPVRSLVLGDDFDGSAAILKLATLFNPLSGVVGVVLDIKEKVERELLVLNKGCSWQDRLLYRSRSYITKELRALATESNSNVLEVNKDFRAYHFYRRMLEGFDDNWIPPEPIVLFDHHERATCKKRRQSSVSTCSSFQTSQGDSAAFLTPAAFFVPPFELNACKVSPDGLQAFCFLMRRGDHKSNKFEDGPHSERRAAAWPPPFSSVLAHITKDAITPRKPKEWLNPLPSISSVTCHQSPFPFFTMPWKGRCRLVIQKAFLNTFQRDPVNRRPPVRVQHMLNLAAARDQLLAISSDRLSQPSKPAIMVLFGGKDMLALDWLPFVSRMLHKFITKKANERTSQDSSELPNGTPTVNAVFKTAFVLPEYPGYGFSAGHASPSTCLSSALAILDHVSHLFRGEPSSPLDVHVVGYSLGAGVALGFVSCLLQSQVTLPTQGAARVAAKVTLKSLNLIAPPTTVSACAAHILKVPEPFQPFVASLLSKLETSSTSWDNEAELQDIITLILQDPEKFIEFQIHVLHGECDEMVSSELSRKLAMYCKEMILEGMRKVRLNPSNKAKNIVVKELEALQRLVENIYFHNIPGATHLSVAAQPEHQNVVYEAIYRSEFLDVS